MTNQRRAEDTVAGWLELYKIQLAGEARQDLIDRIADEFYAIERQTESETRKEITSELYNRLEEIREGA